MKLRGLVANFYSICTISCTVSVSDLYISAIGPPILLQQNREYINLAQINECEYWE
jgi:hypothetical protein